MTKISLIIVDDHQLIADGFESLLTGISDIELVGRLSDLSDLLLNLKKIPAHIILINVYHLSDTDFELIRIIHQKYPKIRVLAYTISIDDTVIFRLLQAGVKGILTSDSSRQQLLEALYSLRGGYDYFSNAISHIVLKRFVNGSFPEITRDTTDGVNLTTREIEILKLFSESYSNQKIAARLFISVRTVEAHKNNIMQKLRLKTYVDLVKYAIRNKLTEVN
ncbi:MAG: response regulator transcription factor [Bacteroidia bacterium]|nr:response regulator transcription factor [Bacteroidia bacterium]